MYASMVPLEVASKQSSGGMIWPPGKTSMRNRPLLISSTNLPNRWAVPCRWSRAGVQAVDIRHWIFGWAVTLGASATAAAVTRAPPAFARNLRRAAFMRPPRSGQWNDADDACACLDVDECAVGHPG